MVLYNKGQKRFEIYRKKDIEKLRRLMAGESLGNIQADDNDDEEEEDTNNQEE